MAQSCFFAFVVIGVGVHLGRTVAFIPSWSFLPCGCFRLSTLSSPRLEFPPLALHSQFVPWRWSPARASRSRTQLFGEASLPPNEENISTSFFFCVWVVFFLFWVFCTASPAPLAHFGLGLNVRFFNPSLFFARPPSVMASPPLPLDPGCALWL